MSIEEWLEKVVNGNTGFLSFEDHEWPMFHKGRDYSLAAFVIRALANPLCNGSEEVLAAIQERRAKLSELPTVEQVILA